jgi:biotin operon repressor
MSMKLTALAMDVRVGNPLRKLVLLKLCDNANDKGECWPSIQHIADQCEISRRSVINHVQALVDAGFVTVVNRGREGKQVSNLYLIDLAPKPPAESAVRGAGDAHLGVQEMHRGGAGDSPLRGAGDAHGTSHSLEPITEPKKNIQKKSSEASRGTRLPNDWSLPSDWVADVSAIDERLLPGVAMIAAKFRDYWVAKPGAGGRKVCWRSTWRNWLRREAERLPVIRPGPRGGSAALPVRGGAPPASPGVRSTRDRTLEEDLLDRSWAR